jgi:nucleoid-associated protein EbfC
MFDKLKQMGALASLFQNKEKLKEAGERIREKAKLIRAVGEGGAGAVRITMDGRMHVLHVELTPALTAGMAADDRTRELAGSLIADAVIAAQQSAQASMREIIDREASDLGLSDLAGELGNLLT